MTSPPQRIVVVGCSGSGKSTLARAIGARSGLPVIHLDTLYWQPGWKPHPDTDAFSQEVRAIAASERWVIDGGFMTGSSTERFSRADTVVLFDLPRSVCLWRAVTRLFKYWGKTRPDLAPGCPERFDLEFYHYIWTYRTRKLPGIEAMIAEHCRGQVIRIKRDADGAAFLESLQVG